ncbi:acyltransferase family protein [Pseudomonas sp. RIT-PI-q]|uniref:acyltransferase family protein n=1 Tax=Pseudomonas sp. RIT-PI-q TaxID=1690247 RepID=UPI0007511D77|nr:acyltransferase [Pseudomonas sp. RIT-PI-q]
MSVKETRKYAYIDALRGLAIILVVLVHSSQSVKPTSSMLSWFMNEGARGVQLFYIASAITLCMSWAARKTNELHPVRNFYIRRIFRIAPMFYVAITGFLYLNGTLPTYWAPNGIEWWFVPVTALFLHGFHPETINSVVPGGWSVAVEMTFYLIFPALMWVKRYYWLAIMLIACLCLQQYNGFIFSHVFVYEERQKYLIDVFSFYNFLSQVPVFIMGVMAYVFLAKEKALTKTYVVVGGVVFALLLTEFLMQSQSFVSHHVIAGGLFALFSIFLAYHPTQLLVNPVTVLLGKLSFSMYLIHIAVLKVIGMSGVNGFFGEGNKESVVFFLFVLIVSVGVSWVTYHFIEKPGITLGRKLIDRLEADQSNVDSTSLPSEPVK